MTYKKDFLRPRMWTLALLAMAMTMCCAVALSAQTQDQNKKTDESKGVDPSQLSLATDSARKSYDLPEAADKETEGGDWVGFKVKQAAEFGGRISDFTGNQGTWDTFVNLGSGPRLLEYSLDMHSPNHTGLLFDDLTFNNFGYGGDPNNLSRLNFSKGAIYNFSALFRRDQNIFDYNLFANPLNPATSSPFVPILQSPHEFLLTRRMTDTNLNLFPLAPVRVRLGWSRVVNEGNVFSSIHQGTDSLLFQPTLNTQDTYTIGASFRFIPRTSINYDQFYTYFKGDNTASLATPAQESLFGIPGFFLPGGLPVSLGLPFNTAAGQPCTVPLVGGFVNPACNGNLFYSRVGRQRNSYPTEQLTVQSNYFKRVDFSARFTYSDAEADNPAFSDIFNGLITRTRARNVNYSGSSIAKRINIGGDFGITVRLSDRLRLIDNFRYDQFRIPTGWNYLTNTLVGATLLTAPNTFDPATCPPPFTAATCPQHIAGSPPDVSNEFFNQFLRQETNLNTVELEYDFTRYFSGYIGYRYAKRDITTRDQTVELETFFPTLPNRGDCTGLPLDANGVCQTSTLDQGGDFVPINTHSALLGFSARPSEKLRFSFDTEQMYADNTFTRIMPRHMQIYKGRIRVKPADWWSAGGAVNIRENRNDTADINNKQHNRSFAFNTVLAPAEGKWGLDLSYDYNDIFSQTNICFVATPVPATALSCGAPFLASLSTYTELTHNASGSIYLKPVRRVTAAVGYTITSSTGDTLILNPNAPTGPLSFNYHLPTASLAIEISKNLLYKTGWNFYDYNEKSDPGPTLPRDFRGNVFTISLRYSM